MKNLKFAAVFLIFGVIFNPDAATVSANDAILVEFSSSNCAPCRAMAPVIERLERGGVPVRHVDVNREQRLSVRYGIRRTPTYIVVAGGKEVTRLVGVQTHDQLRRALATNPAGPLFATNSRATLEAPATRLAPINRGGQFPSLTSEAADRSTGAPRGGDRAVRPASSRSESMPNLSTAAAVERARAATVRIKVFDGKGYGVGTGTIIDTHGEEALVLTCGHLFRDTEGKGKIQVELFVGGQPRAVDGQIIDYDADEKDIALVAIRPGLPVTPVPVIGVEGLPRSGQAVFSFGCDRGDAPSRRDTRITAVNKYNQHQNASNLEIAGAPIDGRSGGGLFDASGRLVGVCNSADYKSDIGIYTGPGSIHWQLDRAGLSHLHGRPASSPGGGSIQLVSGQVSPRGLGTEPPAESPQLGRWDLQAEAGSQPALERSGSFNDPPPTADREVIVIIRDKQRPDVQPQVMTVRQPSQDFMRMLKSQGLR